MPPDAKPPADAENRLLCRTLAALLIVGSFLLHAAYLTFDCPLDLAPDEAHYWDWSRHLDWSYYSKGPLVAYLIRGGCEVLGPLLRPVAGSDLPAVRMPAALCGSLLLLSLYVLTVQTFGRERLALAVVGFALTLPVIGAASSLMTIDAPYTCCWGWALVLAHRAVFRGSGWAWPFAGLLIGLGILAKYTMVVFLPSIGLFLLATRAFRPLLLRPGFWIMTSVAGVCSLPILVWNVRNGWVTVLHVGGLATGHDVSRWHWLGPLNYLGTQCALFLGFWFAAWVAALVVYRPWKDGSPNTAYLWWMAAPMFALFLGFSVKTGGGEPNWPVTAYVSGLVLASAWVVDQLGSAITWRRCLSATGLSVACGAGLAINLFMHESAWLYPGLARVACKPTPEKPFPLRQLDPTCRLMGWGTTLAQAVDEARQDVRRTGEEAVLAGTSWALPGELGFYCKDHPPVYCVGLPFGDRHSQYDLWTPNPIAQHEAFAGRTFIVVGNYPPEALRAAFAQVEPPRAVTHYVRGQPVAGWVVTIAHGFRGFPCEPAAGAH